jgi:hypothetical protein
MGIIHLYPNIVLVASFSSDLSLDMLYPIGKPPAKLDPVIELYHQCNEGAITSYSQGSPMLLM